MPFRTTKTIKIGGFSHVKEVLVGGNSPVVIQTMWKDRLTISDLDAAVKKIEELTAEGVYPSSLW